MISSITRALGIAQRASGGALSRNSWTASDETWNALDPYQKAAAMALMEADGRNYGDAVNAAGAMVNRAAKSGEDLGSHVSKPIYQPTIEPAQEKRLSSIVQSPEFANLSQWVQRRSSGDEPDPVGGATHFLAKPSTMLALEAQNPDKYKNWGPRGDNWTGYDPKTGQYANQTMQDGSHAFLAPEGAYSAPYSGSAPSPQDTSVLPPAANVVANSGQSSGSDGVSAGFSGDAAPVTSDSGASGMGGLLSGIGKAAQFAAKAQPQTQAAAQPPPLQPFRPDPQRIAQLLAMAQASGLTGAPDQAPAQPHASGGAVNSGLDTGQNIPEAPDSLVEQQRQLVEGRRPAQMFPLGTQELTVPPGMKRLETPRGVFHYNPTIVSADDVAKASAGGRENEILGLGPHSKADVKAHAARTGEHPVVLTERSPQGTEVKGSVTMPSQAFEQGRALEASKTPGNTVSVEPLGTVLAQRGNPIDRAMATARGFADGGDVGDEFAAYAREHGITDGPNPDNIGKPYDATRREPELRGSGPGESRDPFKRAGFYDTPEHRIAKGIAEAPANIADEANLLVRDPVLHGAENVSRGISEHDPLRGLAGAAEIGGTALGVGSVAPRVGVRALDALGDVANAAYRNAPRAAATTGALLAPDTALAAQEGMKTAAEHKAEYIANHPKVKAIKAQLNALDDNDRGLRDLMAEKAAAEHDLSKANDPTIDYPGRAARDGARAAAVGRLDKANKQIYDYRVSGPLADARATLSHKFDDAQTEAGDEFLSNAPFRDRHPGVAEAIALTGGVGAFGLPWANTMKANLADRFVIVPSIQRSADAAERALLGGTAEPSMVGKLLGYGPVTSKASEPAFERAKDVLATKLENRKAASPSYLGNAALGTGIMQEARMIPEEDDAFNFGPDHPTGQAAREQLKNPGYYESGLVPSVLAGSTLGAMAKKGGDLLTKSESPEIARAMSLARTNYKTKLPDLPPASVSDMVSNAGRNGVEDAIKGMGLDPTRRSPAPNIPASSPPRPAVVRETAAPVPPRAVLPAPERIEDQAAAAAAPGRAKYRSDEKSIVQPFVASEVAAGNPVPSQDAVTRALRAAGNSSVAPKDFQQRLDNAQHVVDEAVRQGLPPERAAEMLTELMRQGKMMLPSVAATAPMLGGDNGPSSTDISPVSDREGTIDRALRASGQYAHGGGVPGQINRALKIAEGHNVLTGPVHGVTPGRADHVPTRVAAGSHIIPSDIVSGLGQGNTNAGMNVLHQMFHSGPYGMPMARHRADGGQVEPVEVLLSDGEYAIPPEAVEKVGNGDMQRGHDILDHWILKERENHIKTLQGLPPPAKD